MDNCQTCRAASTLEVTDIHEITPGVWIPLRKRAGCAAHPPVGLSTSHGGVTTLVLPTGYVLHGETLVKG